MAKAASGSSGKSSSAGARTARRSTARRKRRPAPPEYSFGREVLLTTMGCLWIVAGLAIVAVSAGVYLGSGVVIKVLDEIGEHDFAGPRERIRQYEQYFATLDDREYDVEQGESNIVKGVQSSSWVVRPRGSTERRRFVWVHDYEVNAVFPRTNPALCLDVKLGYMTEDEAAAYDQFDSEEERYDPGDVVTLSIVENRFSLIQPQDLQGGWEAAVPPEGPVGVPLISPQEGKERQDATKQEEEAAGDQEGGASPNEATEVVGGDSDTDGPAADEDEKATPIEGGG